MVHAHRPGVVVIVIPTSSPFEGDERGLAWTVDALIMLGLMVAGIGYALHVAAAPQSNTAGADLAERQLEQDLYDLLAIAEETGELERAVVHWDDSRGGWIGIGA